MAFLFTFFVKNEVITWMMLMFMSAKTDELERI